MLLLSDLVDWQARQRPGAVAIRDTVGNMLTRRDLEILSNRIARGLLDAGLQPGDRVAMVSKNCLEYPALYLGAAKAGVVLVPLNFRLAPAEWCFILNDAAPKLIIARNEYIEAIDGIRGSLDDVEHFVALGSAPPDGWVGFEAWVGSHPDDAPDCDIEPSYDAIVMYTSGTTGRPKGVVMTQEIIANSLTLIMLCMPDTAGVKTQMVLPFCHVAGAMTGLCALATGGSLYVHEDFDPPEVVRVLDEENIGYATFVPAMIQALLLVPAATDRSYEHLRRITYGASPIAEPTLRQALEVFGCSFSQSFGQTEVLNLTMLSSTDHKRALSGEKPELLRSCGLPTPGASIRIVDDSGNELPPMETGEIVARSLVAMKGYWKLPEATEAVFNGGWLHTGDAGYVDDEGYLFIRDRINDTIVSGGENVYPAEVEQVLFAHPAVADAAVIGIPDERWGEAVHAVVQLRDGEALDADGIIEFCRSRLGGYKRPRSVAFVDVIPRNASMKALRKDLRAPYWQGRDRVV